MRKYNKTCRKVSVRSFGVFLCLVKDELENPYTNYRQSITAGEMLTSFCVNLKTILQYKNPATQIVADDWHLCLNALNQDSGVDHCFEHSMLLLL